MKPVHLNCSLAGVAIALGASSAALGQVRITEFMVTGSAFVEFTNVGTSDIDMTNWSYDDSTRFPATVFFGTRIGKVSSGESIIMAFEPVSSFRATWDVPEPIRVVDVTKGSGTELNAGGDEINLFDASNAVVDRLTFPGTGTFDGTGVSGNVPPSALGLNDNASTVASFAGDDYASYSGASFGLYANPGIYTPVPEPAAAGGWALATCVAAGRRRRRHDHGGH